MLFCKYNSNFVVSHHPGDWNDQTWWEQFRTTAWGCYHSMLWQSISMFCTFTHMQLMPILAPDYFPPFSAHLNVTSYMDSINRMNNTFKIITFQWIKGTSIRDDLMVINMITATEWWPVPSFHMPNPKGVVCMSGRILNLQNSTVLLTVDTVAFLDNTSRPSKIGTKCSKLNNNSSLHCPSCIALQNAKRVHKSLKINLTTEQIFQRERDYYLSE